MSISHTSLNSSPLTPLAKCRVRYLGRTLVRDLPTGDDDLEGFQRPLLENYNGKAEEDDIWLTVFNDALQIRYAQNPLKEEYIPIENLYLCAALKCTKNELGEDKFVNVDSEEGKVDNGHPPIFSCLMRKVNPTDKRFECYIYICKTTEAALALVESCAYAFEDNQEIKKHMSDSPNSTPYGTERYSIPKQRSEPEEEKKSRKNKKHQKQHYPSNRDYEYNGFPPPLYENFQVMPQMGYPSYQMPMMVPVPMIPRYYKGISTWRRRPPYDPFHPYESQILYPAAVPMPRVARRPRLPMETWLGPPKEPYIADGPIYDRLDHASSRRGRADVDFNPIYDHIGGLDSPDSSPAFYEVQKRSNSPTRQMNGHHRRSTSPTGRVKRGDRDFQIYPRVTQYQLYPTRKMK